MLRKSVRDLQSRQPIRIKNSFQTPQLYHAKGFQAYSEFMVGLEKINKYDVCTYISLQLQVGSLGSRRFMTPCGSIHQTQSVQVDHADTNVRGEHDDALKVCVHVCLYACMQLCIRICICTFVCLYVCASVCLFV